MLNQNGGIIGPANIPTTTSAKGKWSLAEYYLAKRQNIWPSVTPNNDPYYPYTTLLLPGNGTNGAQNNTFLDGSTNNFTITRNGNTTQGTFSPFSQTGWGNYFDGSGDYLSVPDNAAFTLGSGDFTVEVWVYKTTTGTQRFISAQCGSSGANISSSYTLQVTASEKIVGTINSGATNYTATSSGDCPLNTWTHIAFVRDGNTTRLYINGIQDGTGSVTGVTVNDSSDILGIGSLGAYPSLHWVGYLSNFRLVKGTCVYPNGTTFTPPTAPLTAITNTALLTCQSNRFIDNSTNNFTITRNGDTSVVAFSPFNPTASWSAATNGGSGYFDGSGDYLTFTDSANNLDLGGVQASVDFWFYRTSAGTDFDVFLIKRGPGAGWSATDGIEYFVGINSNQVVIYYNTSGGFSPWSTGVTITPFQWNHLCVATNTSNNISVFLNGTTKATSTFSIAKPTTRTTVNIGVDSTTDANYFIGYMSGMRFLTGSNAFDPTASSITVPTAPPTAVTGTQLLLNYTNAGIYDATSKNDLETVGNAQISNTTAKFGSTSMYFDGTGDWLDFPQSDNFAFRTGDFTVEFWAYFSVASASAVLHSTSSTGLTFGLSFTFNTGGLYAFTTGGASVNWANINPSTLVWQHHALVRSGSTLTWYINGVSQGGKTFTNDVAATGRLRVGADNTGASAMNGYIQDLRFTKGYARYTANFTPPTAAFPTL